MKRIGHLNISKGTQRSKQWSLSIPTEIIKKLNWDNVKVIMFETYLDSNEKEYLVITKEDE
jgi:hypothetical protein